MPLWNTPFSMDVAFAADGRAFLYDTHIAPTWKRPGRTPISCGSNPRLADPALHLLLTRSGPDVGTDWRHPVIDRDNALGTYGALLVASSRLVLDARLDARHRALLGEAATPLLLDFLRDQAMASLVGMRRAWPSPRHRAAAPFVSALDARFAAQTDQLGLLLPSLDALDEDGPGRPGAPGDLCEGSFWRFEGVLWKSRRRRACLRCARMRRASCSRGRTPKSVAHLIARLYHTCLVVSIHVF